MRHRDGARSRRGAAKRRLKWLRRQVRSPSMTGIESPGSAFGANSWLVEEMYEQYRSDPGSVSETWQEFFSDYKPSVPVQPASAPAAAVSAPPSTAPSAEPTEAPRPDAAQQIADEV